MMLLVNVVLLTVSVLFANGKPTERPKSHKSLGNFYDYLTLKRDDWFQSGFYSYEDFYNLVHPTSFDYERNSIAEYFRKVLDLGLRSRKEANEGNVPYEKKAAVDNIKSSFKFIKSVLVNYFENPEDDPSENLFYQTINLYQTLLTLNELLEEELIRTLYKSNFSDPVSYPSKTEFLYLSHIAYEMAQPKRETFDEFYRLSNFATFELSPKYVTPSYKGNSNFPEQFWSGHYYNQLLESYQRATLDEKFGCHLRPTNYTRELGNLFQKVADVVPWGKPRTFYEECLMWPFGPCDVNARSLIRNLEMRSLQTFQRLKDQCETSGLYVCYNNAHIHEKFLRAMDETLRTTIMKGCYN